MRPRSLSKRLMMGLVLLIFMQTLFIGAFYYRFATSIYRENAIQTSLNVLNSDTLFIEGTLARIQEQANKLAVHNDLFDLILKMADKRYSDYHWTGELKKIIYPYLGDFDDIVDINLIFAQLQYSYNGRTQYKSEQFLASRLNDERLYKDAYQWWMPSQPIGEFAKTSINAYNRDQLTRTPVFRLVKQLNMSVLINDDILVLPAHHQRPILIIDIAPSLYGRVLSKSKPTENSTYLVATPEGEVVAASDAARIGTKMELPYLKDAAATQGHLCGEYPIENRDMLVFAKTSRLNGWITSVIVPISDITQSAMSSMAVILLVVAVSMVFVIVFILAFVYRSVQPVSQIARQAEDIDRHAHGGALTDEHRKSETELISYTLGSMNERIEQLMRENSEIARREQDATILLLEMQINPHFLYNSLNKIYLTLHNAGHGELAESILTLSSVLRYSIDSKEHVVYLYKDINQLQQYITACKNERDNRFSVYYDIEADMYASIVPKMLLQPFVENAILHGFKHRKTGGVIRIKGYVENGDSVFTIEDNGEGIPPEMFFVVTEGSEGHIGCANVNRRIKLLYGEQYGISVTSGSGGTCIQIRLPYIVEAQKPD